MPKGHKTVLLPYSAQQMYDLVEKVEDYPQFLPWCGGVTVHERTAESLEATVVVAFKGLRQIFRTSNVNQPPTEMKMQFRDGPFRHFTGQWRFTEMQTGGVRVQFDLDYEFSNKLASMVIGPVFNIIAQTFIDGFVKRARQVYA